jgi:hypothetical protein
VFTLALVSMGGPTKSRTRGPGFQGLASGTIVPSGSPLKACMDTEPARRARPAINKVTRHEPGPSTLVACPSVDSSEELVGLAKVAVEAAAAEGRSCEG